MHWHGMPGHGRKERANSPFAIRRKNRFYGRLRFDGTASVVLGLLVLIGCQAALQMLAVTPLWGEEGARRVQVVGALAAIVSEL